MLGLFSSGQGLAIFGPIYPVYYCSIIVKLHHQTAPYIYYNLLIIINVKPVLLAMPPSRMEGIARTAQRIAAEYDKTCAWRDVLTERTRWK